MGGKFHPKLNIRGKPIAHKYREGKVKRTLKRELKVLETAKRKGPSLLVAFAVFVRFVRIPGRLHEFGGVRLSLHAPCLSAVASSGNCRSGH